MTCKDNQTHYYVIGDDEPIRYLYDGPTDGGRPCVSVLAKNKTEARKLAFKTQDFIDHVSNRRCDGLNPFGGMIVELVGCKHGVCYECSSEECEECLAGV
jgi:hypothetical protein